MAQLSDKVDVTTGGYSLRRAPWEEIEDAEEQAQAVHKTFCTIIEEQGAYRAATLRHMRLYRNLNSMAYAITINPATGLSSQLSLNVVRNMTNAVHSKITKHRVKATFQTAGASYEMREKARDLDAYAMGLGNQCRVYQETKMSFLDTIVTGTGVMKTYADKKYRRPRTERVFSPNLVVDYAEGAYLRPAHYYEQCHLDKHYLMKKYPHAAEQIQRLTSSDDEQDAFYLFQDSPSTELVRVIEAYYFNPDDEFDGYRVLECGGIPLEHGKFTQGNIYSVMRWSHANLGFYGMGLAEELRGIQLEINRLVRKIQNAFGLLSNPYILADRASAIARGQLTDIPGSVINFNGKEPKIVAPQTVHAEVFAHLDRLYQRAYEIAGVSQLSAQAQKPSGFESGRAMLVYEDIESDRFAEVHREWDELHVDVFRKLIRAARQIPNYKVQVYGKGTYRELDFKKDINIEEDEWTIRPQPTAFLGETPPAQIDTAQRLAKSGLVPHPEDLIEMVAGDAPDMAAYVNRVASPRRLVERMVGAMLSGGPFTPPEPEMNLALALDVANGMYLEHRELDEFPAERLWNVRRFMARCKDLIRMSQGGPSAVPTSGATAQPGGPPPLPGANIQPAPAAPPAALSPSGAAA